MNFFTVRDLRTSPKSVWDTLEKEEEVVITNNGKPSALMIPVTCTNFDEVLAVVRQVSAMRLVTRMQQAALDAGQDAMGLEDINSEITAARAEHKL